MATHHHGQARRVQSWVGESRFAVIGRRLNADRTQASTVRDAAAGEAFPTVVDGLDTDRVVDELGRNKDAMLVQLSADEDFLSEACQLLRWNPIQRKLWR